jgi:hypothetical protein
MRRTPALIASLACLIAPLAAESQAAPPPEPDAMAAALGAKVFAENCGRCHNAPDPATHSRREWVAISLHMRVFADLSQDEQRRVLMFLRTYNTARIKHDAGAPASR